MPATQVNIYEAKTQLSRLVERAAEGEDIIIARNGTPVARLSRPEPSVRAITFGVLAGRIDVPDDFDSPLPEDVAAAFGGL